MSGWTYLLVAALCLGAALAADAGEPFAVPEAVSDQTFARPHDLVLSPDGRLLYVADMNHDVVKVLDPETLKTVGVIGQGALSVPHDVAFDEHGRLLVADSGNDRIAIFTLAGRGATLTGELKGDLNTPEGVAAAGRGRVYVTNAGSDDVVLFEGTRQTARLGSHGKGPDQFIRPHDIEVFQGRLYVADPGNDRIQVLGPDLAPVGTIEAPGDGFEEPKYLALDRGGRLYVADQHHDRIKVFADGRLVGGFATGRRGAGRDQLDRPEGVEVLGDRIWISDTYNNRIVRYRRR